MNDDWTYQDEDFDPDSTYIELQFGIDDVYLITNHFKLILINGLEDILQSKRDCNILKHFLQE